MKKIKIFTVLLAVFVFSAALTGCGKDKMKDGYYTAEMSDYTQGWKEYVCILVKNDKIVSAEFNAKNESGYIKAWDNEYMRRMSQYGKTYPNKYTREYVQQLIEEQDNISVEAVSGASTSGNNFDKLTQAVIKQAKNGDSTTAVVNSN